MSNQSTEIDINLPPFDIGTEKYIQYKKFLDRQPNTDRSYKFLNIKPEIVVRKGPYTSTDKVERIYPLDSKDQNNFRKLIQNLKIINFVDDMSSLHVCDGGSFNIEIKGPSMSLSYYECNINDGVKLEGFDELYEAIELVIGAEEEQDTDS